MDPITIWLLLMAGAAVATLTWEKLNEWIASRTVPAGTATILRTKLASGQFQVVTGVFSPAGAKLAEKSWTAKTISPTLEKRFGDGNLIRINT